MHAELVEPVVYSGLDCWTVMERAAWPDAENLQVLAVGQPAELAAELVLGLVAAGAVVASLLDAEAWPVVVAEDSGLTARLLDHRAELASERTVAACTVGFRLLRRPYSYCLGAALLASSVVDVVPSTFVVFADTPA